MEAMEMRVFSVFLLLCFGGFREAQTQTVLTLPLKNNVTQFLGPNVVIVCSSDSMSSTTNQQPSWYRYNPHKELIYDSTSPGDTDTTKYSVGNGNNTLTVMNVQLSDALTYCCNVGGLKDYCANVVLIDSVTPSVNPSNGVKVGDAVNLTCFLSYNAPVMDDNAPFPLSNDQNPNLMMLIGQTDVTGDTTGEQVVGTGTLPHSKIISFNRTVQQGDAGQNLTCTVSSASPKVNNQTSTPINVNVATKHAWINYPSNYSRNSDVVYPVNSVFTCGGDGYPLPTCEWLDGNNKSVENKRMKGNITWIATQQGTYDRVCAATYDPTGNTTYNFTRIYVGAGPSANASKAADNKVGLGVGLGIGLGVPILLGLIILVVILARRKKKASGPYPVKQPETKSKSPATGKSPNGKNNDPTAGPRNNVNPNPNPTYTTPVMPEQTGNAGPKNVRDSPGYGDLGVRHIGGSGSNPHLNESFDSKADASFDSSRNHSAGGNIAFKPGRAGQSPSAPNTSV